MKRYSCLVFFAYSTLIAQQVNVDSLINSLRNSKADTNKVNQLYDLSFSYVNSSPDSVILFGNLSLENAKKLQFKKGIANASYALGAGYYRKGDVPKSKEYFKTCAAIAKEIDNKALAVKGYLGLGNASLALGEYDSAIDFFQKGSVLCEETGDFGRQATLFNNIGILHREQMRNREATTYFRKSLIISYAHADTGNIALAFSNMAMNYKTLQMYDSARYCADSAIYMAEKINDLFTKSHATGVLGLIEFGSGNFEKALPYLRESYTAFLKRGNSAEVAEVSNALGKLYFKKQNTDSALFYYLKGKSLAEESGWNAYMRSSYEGLSDCYSQKGDYKKAYLYLSKFLIAQNTFFDSLNIRKVTELNAKYDAAARQRKIELLEKDKEIQMVNAEQERTVRNTSFAGIGLLVLFGGLTYYRYRQRKILSDRLSKSLSQLKETQQQLIETERLREQEKIRLRVSRDLHDDIGSTLSSIHMLSSTAKKRLVEKDEKKLIESLEKIGERTQNTLDNMSDIIWSIKPGNDSLADVLSRMREYAGTVFEANEIKYSIDFPADNESIYLPLAQRNNLFLIFKEGVNNLAKYSHCTQAIISIKIEQNKILMKIEDNGIGFVPGANPSRGNGLNNMKKRAEESGALLEISSSEGNGTSIHFSMYL